MTFHKCQAYLFYTDYAKLRVVSYPVSTVRDSGSAATFRFKVWGNNSISSSKQNNSLEYRFFFGKLLTSLNFVLSLAIVAVFMVEDQIYGLVLCLYGTDSVSTVKRYRLQERVLVSCSKASKLFSSNRKEQVVLGKIQWLSGLTEEKAQHFLIQTVFFVSVI